MAKKKTEDFTPTKFKGCHKRIIFAITNKGGCGKSFSCRVVTDWINHYYLDKERTRHGIVSGIDLDEPGKLDGFKVFYKDDPLFSYVDWQDDSAKEAAIQRMFTDDGGSDVLVIDGRASLQEESMRKWINMINLAEDAKEYGLGITFMFSITDDYEPIEDLRNQLTIYGKEVDWLVICNDFKNQRWSIWADHPAKKGILTTREMLYYNGGIDVFLPKIDDDQTRDVWEKQTVPFSHKVENLSPWVQKRMNSYLYRVHKLAMYPVRHFLLPDTLLEAEQDPSHDWIQNVSPAQAAKLDQYCEIPNSLMPT